MSGQKKNRRGPKPERVKIDEDWEDAIDKALRKEKPPEGWPKPEDEKQKDRGDDESGDEEPHT